MQLELQTGSTKLLRMHRVLCHEFGSEARSAIRTFLGEKRKGVRGQLRERLSTGKQWKQQQGWSTTPRLTVNFIPACFKIVVFVFIFSVRLPNSGKPVAADTLSFENNSRNSRYV